MDWKRAVWVAGLIVVVILAVAWTIRSRSRSTEMPANLKEEFNQVQVERIDRKTFEFVKLPAQQWEKLGQKDGQYKNPKTGTYTMTLPMKCASCGEIIPGPEFPPGEDRLAVVAKYLCPKCGKKASRH